MSATAVAPPPLIDLAAFTVGEPHAAYHARRGQYLSSHQLAEFRRCPAGLRKRQLGLVAGEPEDEFFAFGRATHTLILEGSAAFKAHYLVSDGPINPKTQRPFGHTSKAYKEWRDGVAAEVFSLADGYVMAGMCQSVRAHEIANALLYEGAAELVLRADWLGVPCQIRADWINPQYGLVDLKTCKSLDQLEDDARRFEYPHQFAFYRSIIHAATGAQLPVYMVGVEKSEPFRCGVWRISDGALGAAQAVNERAMHQYRGCLETNRWPTGFERMRELNWI